MHYKLNQENILLRKLHIGKITYKYDTDPSFLNLEFQKFHDPPTSPTTGLPYPRVPHL